jgi:hypothetical protein
MTIEVRLLILYLGVSNLRIHSGATKLSTTEEKTVGISVPVPGPQ